MSGDVHVRFCEGLGVKFPRATRRLSLLPELGTMGSKRGEVRVTGLSTSYQFVGRRGVPVSVRMAACKRCRSAQSLWSIAMEPWLPARGRRQNRYVFRWWIASNKSPGVQGHAVRFGITCSDAWAQPEKCLGQQGNAGTFSQ